MAGARAIALIQWAEGLPAWSLPAGACVASLIGFAAVLSIGSRGSELASHGLHFNGYGAGGKYWLRRQRHGPFVGFSIGAVMGFASASLLALGAALFAGSPPNEMTVHATGAITAASGLVWAIRAGIWRRRGVHNYAVLDPEAGLLILPTNPTGSPEQGLQIPAAAVTAVETVDLGEGRYDKKFEGKQAVRLRWQAPTGFERRALVVEYATDSQAAELSAWLRSKIDRCRDREPEPGGPPEVEKVEPERGGHREPEPGGPPEVEKVEPERGGPSGVVSGS